MESYLDYINNKLNEKKPIITESKQSSEKVEKFKDFLSDLIKKYQINEDDVNKFLKYLKEDKTEPKTIIKTENKILDSKLINTEDCCIENAVNILTNLGDYTPNDVEFDDDIMKAIQI